jgi:hypothetical protein
MEILRHDIEKYGLSTIKKKRLFQTYIDLLNFCLIPLYEKYSNSLFPWAILDPTRQPSHGDVVGGSDTQTPQHPIMRHIPARLFSSMSMAQRTKTPGAHETPPSHTLDHVHEGLHGESHEDIGFVEP